MSEPKTPEERHAERRDELETMLIREAVSLGAMAVILLLMSPKVQIWVKAQARRLRSRQTAREVAESKALAGLRRELSRDLPLVERGLVDP